MAIDTSVDLTKATTSEPTFSCSSFTDRVVLVENGQVAMDTPVPLARSRNPADPAFVALEHAILQRVLQGPNAQPASTPTPAPAIHVSQLQWAL